MVAPIALRSMPTKASLTSTEANIKFTYISSTGNEKHRCTASSCSWGGSTAGVLTAHLRKFHGDVPPSSGAIMQPIPQNSAYKRETIVDSSASSWSYDFGAPTNDDPNPGETFLDKLVASSFSNKGTRFDQPMYSLAPTTKEIFIWTSPATGFQHGNVRYSPEAKQLYPAASTNSLDDGLGLDPFLGGYGMLNDDDLSYSDDGTIDSYGSMTDTAGRMIMFDTPTLADARWGYQYAPLPIYPALPQAFVPAAAYPGSLQASWNGSNVGASQQTMGYGSIEGNNHRQHGRRRTVRRSMTCQNPRATKRTMSMTRNSIDMIDFNTKWDMGRLSDPVWMALL
ncbi:hypothetical protein EDD85DRAFT_1027812 [Armillaria nabsnona]|nr:hypothetical protein EDD85DRAFT_1027812 [Armillaria nabsnona]